MKITENTSAKLVMDKSAMAITIVLGAISLAMVALAVYGLIVAEMALVAFGAIAAIAVGVALVFAVKSQNIVFDRAADTVTVSRKGLIGDAKTQIYTLSKFVSCAVDERTQRVKSQSGGNKNVTKYTVQVSFNDGSSFVLASGMTSASDAVALTNTVQNWYYEV